MAEIKSESTMSLIDSKVNGLQAMENELQAKELKLEDRESALESKSENMDSKKSSNTGPGFGDPFFSFFDGFTPFSPFSEVHVIDLGAPTTSQMTSPKETKDERKVAKKIE